MKFSKDDLIFTALISVSIIIALPIIVFLIKSWIFWLVQSINWMHENL